MKVELPQKLPKAYAKAIDASNYQSLALKESKIQTSIEIMLQTQEKIGNLFYIKNNSGAISFNRPNGSQGYMRAGKKGSSDFIVFFKGGKTVFLEVKTATGKQQDSQKEFEKLATSLGYEYVLVRSVQESDNYILTTIQQIQRGNKCHPK